MAKILQFPKSAVATPAEPAASPTVKFFWNGIKVDGKLYLVSISNRIGADGTLTIYGKNYQSIPKIEGLNITNDSDHQSDYFCNDVIRVKPDNIHYAAVKEAFRIKQERKDKKITKREAPKGKPVTMLDKIQVFAAAVEASEYNDLVRMGCACASNVQNCQTKIKPPLAFIGMGGRFFCL